MIGGFCDAYAEGWDEAALAWFEALLEEEDVAIMAWAIGTQPVPERYAGAMIEDMRRLDFIRVAR